MADITTTRIFTDGEKGITAAKLNDIVASSVIQPAFVSSKPVASTADPADNMLLLKAAGTYAQTPFSTIVSSVASQLPSQDSEIWSVRLRSFNACGNCNFEVDQRNINAAINNPASGTFVCDRWNYAKSALTGAITFGARNQFPFGSGLVVPGTSFAITSSAVRVILNTQQASLAAGDFWVLRQFVEGPQLRELSMDVHSISLLVRSSVAGLKFTVYLRDGPSVTKGLFKLCTIPAANVWTLITLPNLPVWVSGGNWNTAAGNQGYEIGICLGAGTNFTAPAADTWQSGLFMAAPGTSNFLAQAVNAEFFCGFIQHEPGAVCSTFQDKTFQQNYDEVLRYYCKSWDYELAPGSASSIGMVPVNFVATSAGNVLGQFPKLMAKVPTVVSYAYTTGAINSVNDSGGVKAVTGINFASKNRWGQVAGTFVVSNGWGHFTADTGW